METASTEKALLITTKPNGKINGILYYLIVVLGSIFMVNELLILPLYSMTLSVLVWHLSRFTYEGFREEGTMPCLCEMYMPPENEVRGGLCDIAGFTTESGLLRDSEQANCDDYGTVYFDTPYTLYCITTNAKAQTIGVPFSWIVNFFFGACISYFYFRGVLFFIGVFVVYILYCCFFALVWCLVSMSGWPTPSQFFLNIKAKINIVFCIEGIIECRDNMDECGVFFFYTLMQICNLIAMAFIIVLLCVYDQTVFASSSGDCAMYREYYGAYDVTLTWDPFFKAMVINGGFKVMFILFLISLIMAIISRRTVYTMIKCLNDDNKPKSLLFRYFAEKTNIIYFFVNVCTLMCFEDNNN